MAGFSNQARVGDICDFIKGKKPDRVTEVRNEGYLPYILIESFTGHQSRFTNDINLPNCIPEDVLMVMDGASSGLVATGIEGAIGSTLAAIRPKTTGLFPKYLYYWLRSKYALLNQRTRGSAIPHVDKKLLQDLLIPIPERETQERIASILDKAEKVLQKRQSANDITARVMNSVFLKMFGDPVTNPMQWRTELLDNLLTNRLVHGKSIVREKVSNSPSGIPLLRLSALTENGLDSSQIKYYNDSSPEVAGWYLKKDDILISRSNTLELVGRVGRYTGQPNPCISPDLMIRAQIDSRKAEPNYIEFYLRTGFVRKFLRSRARGTSGSMPKISNTDIRDIEVCVPPLELQKRFVSICGRIESIRERQKESKIQIKTIFDSLMSKAFA
jgi:type I restriction enzyme S subunit